MDNIPVVVSNSCLKGKKKTKQKTKTQELISDSDTKLASMSLAREQIGNQVKESPNEGEKF